MKTFPPIYLLLANFCLATEPTEGERLFALKVKPLFSSRCMACHGEEGKKIKGGLDMRTRETLLKGGDEFGDNVLVPG
ncbi:hypothetical protein OAJ05_02685, partial [Verrucomicrobia bacterium]|nr:hypothetical protein [Verrucomicrobiota bacterium]